MPRTRRSGIFEEVYALVRRVPEGRVITYGEISRRLGRRLSPLAVGWALNQCGDDSVPWQRVVNAAGGCSTARRPGLPPRRQQRLLEQEGVEFRKDSTLDLERYRWTS